MPEVFRPFPYQTPMVEHLLANERSALFVPPGKGKTVVTLKAIDDLFTTGEARGVLIVAPLRVCSITWPDQVERWQHSNWMRVANLRTKQGLQAWHDRSAEIYLINSELLQNRLPLMFPKGSTSPANVLVIDELSLAKNHSSKRFKALRKHLHHFDRRIGLTGTPVPNNYLDLFAQIRLLDDGDRLGKFISHYKEEHFYSDYMGFTWTLNPGAKDVIDRKLSDLCLVDMGSGNDLPASSVIDVPVTMPQDAAKQYKALQKELLVTIKTGEIQAPSAATLVNKLLQFTSGSVYDDDKNVHHVHDSKLHALNHLLQQHTEPMLVLCAYKHESARILKTFPQAAMFDERNMADWQAGKIPIWVADPRSLSHGIDGLQKSCRIAIWMTLTYSNETYLQTNARLIRTGQASETIVYRIICPGTIDDAVAESLRIKSDTQSGMLNAIHALQRLNQ